MSTYKELSVKYRRSLGHTHIEDDQYVIVNATQILLKILDKLDEVRRRRNLF